MYALLLFLLTMLVIVIPISIQNIRYRKDEVKRIHSTYRCFVIWMNVYLTLIFISVKRKGVEYFEKGKNYVVVLNHSSFADIPISSPFVVGPNKTLAKIEFMKVPIFNIIYKSGSILVDRSSDESRKRSLREMRETLDLGIHLTLYPEGTRNKTSKPLQPFYDGAFRTAISAQKDILPGILFNTAKVLPNRPKLWAWPYTIRLEFLKPISTQGLNLKQTSELKDETFRIMEKYIIDNK